MEKCFLINGGGDWFPNGKANGADGSHRVNGASCDVQVTERRRRPQAQLPPNSNYLCAERLISLIKGRRAYGEDMLGRLGRGKIHSAARTIRACCEGSERSSN